MKKDRFKLFLLIFGIFLFLVAAASSYASYNNLVFHKPIRMAVSLLVLSGLIFILVRSIFTPLFEERTGRFAFYALLIVLIGYYLLMGFFSLNEKESTAVIDGAEKVKIESSSFMSLEICYCEPVNGLWYKQYPCSIEVYDDGDINQWVYTDYYDEKGNLSNRVFKED